jgi:hypothetical protein
LKSIMKVSLLNGFRVTLFLFVCSFLMDLVLEPYSTVARVFGWIPGWPGFLLRKFIPRFDDPPLIGLLATLALDFLIYSLLIYVALSLTRRRRYRQ